MPSATVAESRLSRAASAATARALGSRTPSAPRSTKSSDGAGSPCGSSPIRARSIGASSARIVAAATPTRENGTAGRHRPPSSISAATPSATTIAAGRGCAANRATASAATAHTFSPCAPVTPSAAGTCCSAMTTAMPAVKPSITGVGR